LLHFSLERVDLLVTGDEPASQITVRGQERRRGSGQSFRNHGEQLADPPVDLGAGVDSNGLHLADRTGVALCTSRGRPCGFAVTSHTRTGRSAARRRPVAVRCTGRAGPRAGSGAWYREIFEDFDRALA